MGPRRDPPEGSKPPPQTKARARRSCTALERPSGSGRESDTAITGWLTWLLHRAWEAADPEPSEGRDFAERTLRETLDHPLSLAKLGAMVAAAG